ncbi:AAA family ATPase [Salmonella enterica subsp. enterica serovar Java]|uniref:ATP-binding protein n=2 Tax=Salmonella enterica TaxID=28901 RepID=A0A749L507_SALER|nr:AAA family ATPase [Salmonella enterica subsp. enterica serovar Java]EAM8780795.1 AAA family ATPase [Salmonella enterica]EBV8395038.1 AAA family ATPase [Salmonella enterica subsp. enterica serovar Virchow]EBX7470117.1 AAA family ATPase [Salmonella enterica subsp. enterica serovar Bareilly]EBZ6268997.1 AAA family ATPase [Salmonella enterica subsp. enterica serovar Oranienburg]ECA0405818.1 AAA family ATPase [Salmonella enterica subsp. enterica serovar Newport]ECC9067929.1 AAA family ATPase [S
MSDNLLNKLTQLKLPAMAGSLIRQRETPQTYDELSFEERLTMLADDELLNRENGRVARLRKNASLKYQAAPEGLHYPVSRGLRAEQMRELLSGHYILHKKGLLITGPTGCGKSWIANALGEQACRQKHSVQYWRTGRLLELLAQGRVDGSWLKHLKQLQKIQVLILDDLGLEPLTNAQCNDLLEILEDRYGQSSTIVVSQFPVDKWHGLMENPTTADAILDRLVHNSHRLVLQGESMRKNKLAVESDEKRG